MSNTLGVMMGVKKLIEQDGDKVTAAELMDFKKSLSDADKAQFAAELTEILGVEVDASK